MFLYLSVVAENDLQVKIKFRLKFFKAGMISNFLFLLALIIHIEK